VLPPPGVGVVTAWFGRVAAAQGMITIFCCFLFFSCPCSLGGRSTSRVNASNLHAGARARARG
jgi:hypothetical protein